MQKVYNGIVLVPFFVFTLAMYGQQNSISPYSRLGVGDVQPLNYTRALSMGGANLGLKDAFNVNISNPASYSALELTTFEVGMEASLYRQEQQSPTALSVENSTSGLRYLSIAVPVADWWGSAVGLQPYSFKGYNIQLERTGPDGLGVTDVFIGSGGLNQIYWGNAFEVARGLSLGFNAKYIFGSLIEANTINWDTSAIFDSQIEDYAKSAGFRFNYGLQYNYQFKDRTEIGAGLTFSNKSSLNSRVDRYAYVVSSNAVPVDTLENAISYESTTILPSRFGLGLTYGKRSQSFNMAYAVSADFEYTKGSEFKNYDGTKNLADGYRIELGGLMVPAFTFENLTRNGKYLSQVEYRMGGFYEKTLYQVNGTQLPNYGITFGLGIPVRSRSMAPGEVKFSTINAGVILGKNGMLDNGLVQEKYLKFYLGVTINDKWFIKYKYR